MNLSQQKRERMLNFLNDLKEKNKSNVDVIKEINEIETELTSKKYGLVWEEHEENVDIQMQDNILVFSEEKSREIRKGGANSDFLLEGDNLHSLYLLEKTHKNNIDFIYIDPPYNTGKDDFKYDDKFIVEDDDYKNSKWLSFMNKRLRIAHNLLKDTGIICISIDDNEQAPLKILCDEIFGSNNLLSIYHIQVRYANKNLNEKKAFQECIEYVLIYAKNIAKFSPNRPEEEYSIEKFNIKIEETGKFIEEVIGGKKVKIFKKGNYKIVKNKCSSKEYLKETWASGAVVKGNASGKYFETYLKPRKEIDGLGTLYKVDGIGEDGLGYRYFTGPKKANATQGLFYSGIPTIRLKEMELGSSVKYKTIHNIYDYSAEFGNIRLEGGVPFNSGKKPIKLIKQLINYHKGKDITILDFFAGSGSTGHAVIDLNNEDEGNRKYILCTNNENKICEEITYKRLSNVLSEQKNYNNLKYYKTDFISKSVNDIDIELNKHVKELVQLENAIDIDDKTVLLAFDNDDLKMQLENIKDAKLIVKLYISRYVMLNSKQKKILKNTPIEVIPDYYFKKELKEKGLNWR